MEHPEEEASESQIQYFSTTDYSGGDMYGYNTPAPPKPVVDQKRPLIITVFCVIGFIGVIAAPIIALTEDAKRIGEWYQPFLLLNAVIYLCTYIGLWMMKGWAPILLTIMFLVNQGVLYGMGMWTPVSLGNALVVLIALAYMKKMD